MFTVETLSQFKGGNFFDKFAEDLDGHPNRYGLVLTDPYATKATARIMRVITMAQEATDLPVDVLGPVPGMRLWVIAIPITYPVTRGAGWRDIVSLSCEVIQADLVDPGDVCPVVVAVEMMPDEVADIKVVIGVILAGLSLGTSPHQMKEGYDRSRYTPNPAADNGR